MFIIRYDPATKIYKINIDGVVSEGRLSIYQVLQVLQNYILRKEGKI